MDQIKVGKFIASCRKEGHMTQADLAEKLGISDRAVSKWETGRSMPDSGIMLELCALLHINVNELLSGERIMTESYDKRVEENLLAMRREIEQRDKRMLRLEMWLDRTDNCSGNHPHSSCGAPRHADVAQSSAGYIHCRHGCCSGLRCGWH